MLFVKQTVDNEDLKSINNFFAEFGNEFEPVKISEDNTHVDSQVNKYITSLVCGQYQKSVQDIENTNVHNKRRRKRSLQQVMQESFFSGANRFGNNFIA